MGVEIEEQIYKVYKEKSKEYMDKVRSVFSNLRDPKNPELRSRLLNGEITPVQIATMDATIMASRSLQEVREQFTRNAVESSRTDLENEKARLQSKDNSFFECKECKSKHIDVQVIQYGTEEDSERNFITCYECNHQWMQD